MKNLKKRITCVAGGDDRKELRKRLYDLVSTAVKEPRVEQVKRLYKIPICNWREFFVQADEATRTILAMPSQESLSIPSKASVLSFVEYFSKFYLRRKHLWQRCRVPQLSSFDNMQLEVFQYRQTLFVPDIISRRDGIAIWKGIYVPIRDLLHLIDLSKY